MARFGYHQLVTASWAVSFIRFIHPLIHSFIHAFIILTGVTLEVTVFASIFLMVAPLSPSRWIAPDRHKASM